MEKQLLAKAVGAGILLALGLVGGIAAIGFPTHFAAFCSGFPL